MVVSELASLLRLNLHSNDIDPALISTLGGLDLHGVATG
jgi:hypothetical protein